MAAAVVVAAFVGCQKETSTSATKAGATETKAADAKATSASPAPEAVRKMLGRWARSDGGYVLELRDAEMSGVIRASYYNPERPKPVNVSRSIWMQGAEGLQVIIELNDVGYPGATYVLSHDTQSDRLVGKYNQPAMQQSFDIDFVRHRGPLK